MAGNADPDYERFIRRLVQQQNVIEIEDEEEEDDDEDDDDDDDDNDDAPDLHYAMYLSEVEAGRVLEDTGATTLSQDQGFRDPAEAGAGRQSSVKRTKGVETTPLNDVKDEISGGGEWERDEIDGLFCPICMEGWTTGGDHQVCCIPCGHMYGKSCIKRWLRQRGSRGKCPQCNRKCTPKDIRVLYASRIVVVDEELQKKVQSLESACASLEKRDVDWCKKQYEWQKREADLHMQMQNLRERTSYLEGLLEDVQSRPSGLSSIRHDCQGKTLFDNSLDAEFGHQGCPNGFLLLKDLQIEGARFFDVDVHSQTMIIARRLSGMGGSYVLTKISLLPPHERENIQIPVSTKAIKDLRVSPHARLALLASLGKKLSVLSMESNNTILTYDLPTPAWSCTWDVNDSHYVHAGLQNGMVLEFDLRQTLRPVESMTGFTGNPIHTVHSLSADLDLGCRARSVLTASSAGLCHWNFGSSDKKSFLIPESVNQGVCISLAYGPRSGDIVASFRPKIEMAGDITFSQSLSTPSSSLIGQGVQGSHVLFKRVDSNSSTKTYQKLGSTSANVNDIRLPKSAVIDRMNQNSLYAAGDEVTCDLVLQHLPSLKVVQRLKSQKNPIRDVKYSQIQNSELLSCLSEDTVQLFSSKLSRV